MSKVAWIGLGVMGYPMAGHLRERGGHDVTVFNRTRDKAEHWAAEFGGSIAESPAIAALKVRIMSFFALGNDDHLRGCDAGTGRAPSRRLRNGAIAIDHTTASATIARELHARPKEKGAGFLDAPVSGGQAGAENGTLTDHGRRRSRQPSTRPSR